MTKCWLYVDWKHKLETNQIGNIKKIGNNRFRLQTKERTLETIFLDWKQKA